MQNTCENKLYTKRFLEVFSVASNDIFPVSFENTEGKIYLKVPVGGDGCPGDWQ